MVRYIHRAIATKLFPQFTGARQSQHTESPSAFILLYTRTKKTSCDHHLLTSKQPPKAQKNVARVAPLLPKAPGPTIFCRDLAILDIFSIPPFPGPHPRFAVKSRGEIMFNRMLIKFGKPHMPCWKENFYIPHLPHYHIES